MPRRSLRVHLQMQRLVLRGAVALLLPSLLALDSQLLCCLIVIPKFIRVQPTVHVVLIVLVVILLLLPLPLEDLHVLVHVAKNGVRLFKRLKVNPRHTRLGPLLAFLPDPPRLPRCRLAAHRCCRLLLFVDDPIVLIIEEIVHAILTVFLLPVLLSNLGSLRRPRSPGSLGPLNHVPHVILQVIKLVLVRPE